MIPYRHGTRYAGYCDSSAGKDDAFGIAIAHQEAGGHVVLDAVDVIPAPFDCSEAVTRCAKLLGSYNLRSVTGDRAFVGYLANEFGRNGISYVESTRSASDVYRNGLPLFTSRRVELLDHRQLLHELRLLERTRMRGGGERISHPQRSYCHDDVANSCVGALLLAAEGPVAGDYGRVGDVTHSICDYDPVARGEFGFSGGFVSPVDARRGLFPPVLRLPE
jgi:hypothetical protein